MAEATLSTARTRLRWWLLLVLALAMGALLMVGRQATGRAIDVQPVVDPQAPMSLTEARAV